MSIIYDFKEHVSNVRTTNEHVREECVIISNVDFSNMMFLMRALERNLLHVQEEENLSQEQYEQEKLLQNHFQQQQAAIKNENNFDVLQQRLQQQQ